MPDKKKTLNYGTSKPEPTLGLYEKVVLFFLSMLAAGALLAFAMNWLSDHRIWIRD